MTNIEATKPTVFGSFIVDFVLLVIMLIGLLRHRHKTGGEFGLGRTLWKQVRHCHSGSSRWPRQTISLMRISIRKGIIWLILATVAEVPTSVRLAILWHL